MNIGTDKVVFNSTITFTDGGPKEKTVSAVIEDDMIALEDDELITVDLTIVSPTSGVTLGDNPTTTVTIVDNDCKFNILQRKLLFCVECIKI